MSCAAHKGVVYCQFDTWGAAAVVLCLLFGGIAIGELWRVMRPDD